MDDNTPTVAEPEVMITEFGIPIRNIWYMLLYAWDVLPISRLSPMIDVEEAPSLDALLTMVLMKLVKQRMRVGFGRNYITEEQLIQGIRGRVDFKKSIRSNTFEQGKAYCHFNTYALNVPKNQIVKSTLSRLILTGNFGPDQYKAKSVRAELRQLVRMLDGIDTIELNLEMIRRQRFGRNDRDYGLMMAICEFILQKQMPTELQGEKIFSSLEKEKLLLYSVFEKFVANFYRTNLDGWKVNAQKSLDWDVISDNPYLPKLRPDILFVNHSNGKIIILDTKFTAQILIRNLWEDEVFVSSHLYQMYAYLKTQEHCSDKFHNSSGILLYPAVSEIGVSETVQLQNHQLMIQTVNLASPWQDIENRLLHLIQPE